MGRLCSRAAVVFGVIGTAIVVSSSADAAPLDQTFCESLTSGVWNVDTCTVPANSLSNQDVTVPSGVTLVTTASGAGDNLAINVTLTIETGGAMEVTGVSTFIDSGTIENRGSIDVQATALGVGADLTNFGTITATQLLTDDADNYGSVTSPSFGTLGTWTNHCGAELTFTVDTIQTGSTVVDLSCSIAVTITPSPTSGESPLDVTWTITLENDGDEALASPEVALSADGGSTTFATLTAPPASGDTGAIGTLDVGETWTWTVDTAESADVTVTATGAGSVESHVVTFPDDPDARAAASVTVTTTTTTTTTTAAPSTTATPTTSIDAGATLPATGASGQATTNMAIVALLLVLAGRSLVGIRRRA